MLKLILVSAIVLACSATSASAAAQVGGAVVGSFGKPGWTLQIQPLPRAPLATARPASMRFRSSTLRSYGKPGWSTSV